MAHASDTARGKERYEESDLERETLQFTIRDHNDDEIAIVWRPRSWRIPDQDHEVPPFPFQVYVLSSAASVAKDAAFPRKLAAFVHLHWGGGQEWCRYHLEVYRRPFPNILACVAHQRREIDYRNRNKIVPRMVEDWASPVPAEDALYKGRVLVVDVDDWEREGIVFTSFDPPEYENRSRFPAWNVAGDGDIDVVKALRERSPKAIITVLKTWYRAAGGPQTESTLQLRNMGAVSPVLYPAIDPAAHYDVEHEEVHELDSTELPGPATTIESDDEGDPRIINTFDASDLFLREDQLQSYQSETYSDHFGLPITSIWNARLSRTRPEFSFTLYVAFDFLDKLHIHPKALFRCLDKGLIAQEAWTLDIVTNMPSLDAAFQYHSRASVERAPERTRRWRACAHLLVQKTSGARLPGEILEHIEDLLVPPPIPEYSRRPRRPYQDMFLYLDKRRQYTGPLMIYSNPDGSWRTATTAFREELFDPHHCSTCILRVVYQRYWHRVADELHVLWSLCSPRCLARDDPSIPRACLRLTAPEACVWRSSFGIQYINGYPDLTLQVQSEEKIVLPCGEDVEEFDSSIFSHNIWDESIDIIDLETGAGSSPPPPRRREDAALCFDSWAKTRELGFGPGPDPKLHPRFYILEPNTLTKLPLRPSQEWWQHNIRNGRFKGGRAYAFQLKANCNIPRWTYGTETEKAGTAPKTHGPFNLPPIPVAVDESPHAFTFRVESIGAPHGSFNR